MTVRNASPAELNKILFSFGSLDPRQALWIIYNMFIINSIKDE